MPARQSAGTVRRDYPGRYLPRPCRHRAVAQLARVPVSKTGGWGFESLLPCECGPCRLRAHDVSRSVTSAVQGEDMATQTRGSAPEKPARPGRRAKPERTTPLLYVRQVIAELRK